MPDLEKLVAKLYTYSIQHRVKAIYFENVSANKLKEFKQAVSWLRDSREIVGILQPCLTSFRSQRLAQLL